MGVPFYYTCLDRALIRPGLADYFQTLYDRKPNVMLRRFQMPLWQRLVFTLIVIVVASFVAGLIWHRLFGFSLPSYVGGVIGGLTAVPFWELLKRIGSQKKLDSQKK
jgi:lipopolysaccharide export LptBFGC system permease protein LptF